MIDAALIPALYDLLVVARTGSVGQAAARLNKTPSAVSQQLRRVRENLGVELLERHGRGIRLSAAGEAALPAITRLFDEAESTLHLLQSLSGDAPTLLRISCSDYLGKALLVPAMRGFAGGAIRFEVTTAHSAASLRQVERGEADLAIVTSREPHPALEERLLFSQRFCWVGPKLRKERGYRERLSTEPVLRLAPGSIGRALLDEFLAAEAIEPVSTIDVPSVSLLLSYASGGVGVGLAPLPAPGDAVARSLWVAEADLPELPVKLVRRRRFRLGTSGEEFVEALAEVAKTQAG
ncbi:MAG: LysR family transcriptional regulator [Chrysiogenetes bacterium]|nr:LysR family transcriptional regulator [Chrysiogenetes bacterium]